MGTQTKFETLNAALRFAAQGHKGITFINGESDEKSLSYKDLYENARTMLANLQAKGVKKGHELVIQLEDYEMFVTAFWACQFGGIIPVPVAIGNNTDHRMKLIKILDKLNHPNMITSLAHFLKLENFMAENNLAERIPEIKGLTTFLEEATSTNTGFSPEIDEPNPDEISFIQFSSGSTNEPKGVMLTHRNILTNIYDMMKCSAMSDSDSTLTWMPLTHDMGIIGCHLMTIVANLNQYLMPTQVFIRRPVLWLLKTNQYKITMLYSPNFGFRYFLSFFKPEIAKDWDLSRVRIIFNGAEPIDAALCNRFLETMAAYNMPRSAMYTVYGLAEASLAVSFPHPGEEFCSMMLDRKSIGIGQRVKPGAIGDKDSVTFVGVGYPIDHCGVRIADDGNNALSDDMIGHVQLKGPNVTSGYYNNPVATQKVITPDGWLDTGDLGFMREGRLIITGRVKDVIFVNGQNYYAHDIERVAENVEGIELGEVAACGVYNDKTQQEDIILFVLFKKSVKDFMAIEEDLMECIGHEMNLALNEVVPVKKMPKTTSGKIQRYILGQKYAEGEFEALIKEKKALREGTSVTMADGRGNEIEEKLLGIWKKVFETDKIGKDDHFTKFGGESLKIAQMGVMLQKEFNLDLMNAFEYIQNYPTVSRMAAVLSTASSLDDMDQKGK